MEMFDLFQRHRHYILEWLQSHPADCNEMMENIVKTVTFIGSDKGEWWASRCM